MKRTRLSNKLIIPRALFILFMLLFLSVALRRFSMVIFIAGMLVFGMVFYQLFYLPDRIDFDGAKMYIAGRGGYKEVELENIQSITITGLSLNNSLHLLKIRYRYKGDEHVARFYPRRWSGCLNEFKSIIKEKNPGARV